MLQIISPDLLGAKEIASGGEGRIVEHPHDKKKVIKVYHQPRKYEFAAHLGVLSQLSNLFIKPEQVYFNNKNEVIGFEMNYVNFNNYHLFNNLFNKGFCTANKITKAFKIGILKKLKEGVKELHKKKIVVGDLNQYNIFFSLKYNEILFVDVDSYGTVAKPHGGVLLDDIRDWTTLNINEQTDAWAYDILAFWATTYVHPFKWVAPGNTESLEQRVKSQKSILSKISNLKTPVLYEPPAGDPLKQFMEIFTGRRYMVEFDAAFIPVSAVVTQAVHSASLLVNELYTNVTDMYACNSFISIKVSDKWILIETKIPKVTRKVSQHDVDMLYPSDSNFAYVKGLALYSADGKGKVFNQPYYYYNNGSLSVLDYGMDVQWNFNINNQFSGIDSTQTSVFTKSVVIRNSPIQNFGKKKYLNVPFNNTYKLIEIPEGTKDAYYSDDYVCVEYKERSKVKFALFNTKTRGSIDLDHLAHFAVKGNLIMIPNDGFIEVYFDMVLVMKTDVSNCTRNSKLYNTASGIIMLENNTVYLLNTK